MERPPKRRSSRLALVALLLVAAAAAVTAGESRRPRAADIAPEQRGGGQQQQQQQQEQQQQGPPGAAADCASPSSVNLSKALAERADAVVTGLVLSAGAGSLVCAPANTTDAAGAGAAGGPDLLVDFKGDGERDGGGAAGQATTLLVLVQCVHKGALACRRNAEDANSMGSLAGPGGGCVIAVRVPAEPNKPGADKLRPCIVTPGFRYTLLLSAEPQASCDGAYATAHPHVVDSVRPHLGGRDCAPYPAWPEQSLSADGPGIAGLLSSTCPGAAGAVEPMDCGGDAAGACAQLECPEDSGITCVPKACPGRFMAAGHVTEAGACAPLFISQATGLPVAGCDLTRQRLMRQARQRQRRLDLAAGRVTPEQLGVGGGGPDSRPQLVDINSAMPSLLDRVLGSGDVPPAGERSGNLVGGDAAPQEEEREEP